MKGTFFLKVGLVFILASCFTFLLKNGEQFFSSFNNDYLLSRIVIENVDETYKDFNSKVSTYKDDMSTFYDSLDFYYDDFVRKNRVMVANLSVVEKDLSKLEKPALKLYENCRYEVEDEDTAKMCSIYKENLKGVVDSYNKLVEDYNHVLDSFNAFAEGYGYNDRVVPNYESKMSTGLLKIYEEIK